MVKELADFVLVKLEPMKWKQDKAFALKFGVKKFPALLVLDPTGKKALGTVGDVSAKEVVTMLLKALGR